MEENPQIKRVISIDSCRRPETERKGGKIFPDEEPGSCEQEASTQSEGDENAVRSNPPEGYQSEGGPEEDGTAAGQHG
tara:strand:+ start:8239 stop:8472 length:234 start_codon:yes stop_codon:yes gene_type:complete